MSGRWASARWLALGATIAALPFPARAGVLADNLENATSGTEVAQEGRRLAAVFRTGSLDRELRSVTLLVAASSDAIVEATIFTDGGAGPGAPILALEGPNELPASLEPTTFLAGGQRLGAGVVHWVVLTVVEGAFEWAWTGEDEGRGPGFLSAWGVEAVLSTEDEPRWWRHDAAPMQLRVDVGGCPSDLVPSAAGPIPCLP